MSAIGGAIAPFDWDAAGLTEKVGCRLSHHPGVIIERWADGRASACHLRTVGAARGQQPVLGRNGELCLVMAGECYADAGLKAELQRRGYSFGRGHADAEYCLAVYEEFGSEGFERFNGSFCIAIFNVRTRELLLVSDRLGSRPLFHGLATDGSFIFATQVSGVLCHPGVARDLDKAAVLQFCALQRVIGTRTYHKGVRMLPPASVLRYSGGKVSISPYWRLGYEPQSGSVEEYAVELAATVKKAVGRITEGGARVGLLLSGGLDSRMIVAAAEKPLVCFTFGDYENFESQVARKVAETKGYPFHFMLRPPDQYVDMIEPGVELGSGMHPFNHAHALGFLDAIRAECDVLTHGYGIEILFRGTSLPRNSQKFLGVDVGKSLDRSLTDASLPERLFDRGYNLLGRGMRQLLTPAAQRDLDEVLHSAAQEVLRTAEGGASNPFDRFLWLDVYFRGRFPSFLFELSLRPFIIERSIDFDNEILDLHRRMPLEVRADQTVWVRAMEHLNSRVARVVSANTRLSPASSRAAIVMGRLGQRWRRRRGSRGDDQRGLRQGLSPHSWPRFDWMIRNHPRLRELMTTTLADPEALPTEVFDLDRIGAFLREHLDGRASHRDVLFALLTFGRWHKRVAYGA